MKVKDFLKDINKKVRSHLKKEVGLSLLHWELYLVINPHIKKKYGLEFKNWNIYEATPFKPYTEIIIPELSLFKLVISDGEEINFQSIYTHEPDISLQDYIEQVREIAVREHVEELEYNKKELLESITKIDQEINLITKI